MSDVQLMIVLLTAAAFSALGAAGSRWWYRRYIDELRLRFASVDKARVEAHDKLTYAQRKIEQLQRELASRHRAQVQARADDQAARKRALNDALDAAEQTIVLGARSLPAHGFADTQPL